PFPSAADVIWILAFLPLIYGLYALNKQFQIEVNRILLLFFSLILLIIGVSVLVYLGPIVIEDVETAEAVAGFAYPLFDMILLFFAGRFLFKLLLSGGQLNKAWFLIAISFVVDAFADSGYIYQEWVLETYGYFAFEFVDALFILSYVLLAIGAFTYYHMVSKALE
ncbi:MAG: hypothetical protein ACXAC7_19645, partial [Candidatus Hodarchaeales archaeon]